MDLQGRLVAVAPQLRHRKGTVDEPASQRGMPISGGSRCLWLSFSPRGLFPCWHTHVCTQEALCRPRQAVGVTLDSREGDPGCLAKRRRGPTREHIAHLLKNECRASPPLHIQTRLVTKGGLRGQPVCVARLQHLEQALM